MAVDDKVQRYQCSFDTFFNEIKKIKNKLHYRTL